MSTFLSRLAAEMRSAALTPAGEIATAAGWRICHTGGGCLAWSIDKTMTDGTYVQALVSADGHDYAADPDGKAWCGQVECWHDPTEGHTVATVDAGANLADTLAAVQALFDDAQGLAPPAAETAPS